MNIGEYFIYYADIVEKKIGDVSEINWCDNMKCKHCGKKVFKRIWNDGVLTRMRLCVGCNTINLTGYPPNKGDKRSEAVKNKKKI